LVLHGPVLSGFSSFHPAPCRVPLSSSLDEASLLAYSSRLLMVPNENPCVVSVLAPLPPLLPSPTLPALESRRRVRSSEVVHYTSSAVSVGPSKCPSSPHVPMFIVPLSRLPPCDFILNVHLEVLCLFLPKSGRTFREDHRVAACLSFLCRLSLLFLIRLGIPLCSLRKARLFSMRSPTGWVGLLDVPFSTNDPSRNIPFFSVDGR